MKNDQNRLARLKYELRQKKEQGIKKVKKKLDDEQKEYVEQLGYSTIPFNYEVKTKMFHIIKKETSPLIREIHWASKKGRKKIYCRLKRQDLKTLNAYEVQYRVCKYEIILN